MLDSIGSVSIGSREFSSGPPGRDLNRRPKTDPETPVMRFSSNRDSRRVGWLGWIVLRTKSTGLARRGSSTSETRRSQFADDLLALRRDIKAGSSSAGHDRLCLCASVSTLVRFLPHSKPIGDAIGRAISFLRVDCPRYGPLADIREPGRSLCDRFEANGSTFESPIFDRQSSIANL
jgi:hypothetical protein